MGRVQDRVQITTDVGSFQTHQSQRRQGYAGIHTSIPRQKIRAQIDALFDGSRELVEIIEDVAQRVLS